MGAVYFRRRQWAEAAEQFEAALRIDPSFAEAHLNLGVALLRLGRVDDARRAVRSRAADQPPLRRRPAGCCSSCRPGSGPTRPLRHEAAATLSRARLHPESSRARESVAEPSLPITLAKARPRPKQFSPLETPMRNLNWSAILILAASAAAAGRAETLYNGIVLPPVWPPRDQPVNAEPPPAPPIWSRHPPSFRSMSAGSSLWTIF